MVAGRYFDSIEGTPISTHLRWPGGTVTEAYFDPANPDTPLEDARNGGRMVMGPTANLTFTDFMQTARDTGVGATIVLPTVQLLSQDPIGERTIDFGQLEELRLFVREALARGGNYADARIDAFEIGNEYWTWMTSREYGKAAHAVTQMLSEEIAAVRGALPVEPKILVQEGLPWGPDFSTGEYADAGLKWSDRLTVSNLDILQEFTAATRAQIDGRITHYYAESSTFNNFNSSKVWSANFVESLWKAQLGRSVDVHATEWNVDVPKTAPSQLIRAGGLFETFEHMLRLGIDSANVWPHTHRTTNSLFAERSNGERIASATGLAYNVLARDVNGKALVETDVAGTTGTSTSLYANATSATLIISDTTGAGWSGQVAWGTLTASFSLQRLSKITVSMEQIVRNAANDIYNGAGLGASMVSVPLVQVGDKLSLQVQANASLIATIGIDTTASFTAQRLYSARYTLAPQQPSTSDGPGIFLGTSRSDSGTLTLGDDTILALDGSDRIYCLDGNDTVHAGTGNDAIYGGAGDDSIDGSEGSDMLYGEAGNDTLLGGLGNDALYGGEGDDVLDGGDGSNRLYGDAGRDTLSGGTYSDAIYGGADDDLISGGDGTDRLYGDAGRDTVSGGTGNDAVFGGEGDDVIDGGDGSDALYGDAGNDTLMGGAGDDRMYGGLGDDLLEGGDGADYLLGGGGNDVLDGGLGNDRLLAGLGMASLIGGEGNDLLLGSGGGVFFSGGAGDDSITVSGPARVAVHGGSGNDRITVRSLLGGEIHGDDGNDMIVAGSGAVTVTGGSGRDTILAGSGNDVIDGGLDEDRIFAGAGNDTVTARDDTVFAGTGHDRIVIEGGRNLLYGESGDDSFVFRGGNASVTRADGGSGADQFLFEGDFGRVTLTSFAAEDDLRFLDDAPELISGALFGSTGLLVTSAGTIEFSRISATLWAEVLANFD